MKYNIYTRLLSPIWQLTDWMAIEIDHDSTALRYPHYKLMWLKIAVTLWNHRDVYEDVEVNGKRKYLKKTTYLCLACLYKNDKENTCIFHHFFSQNLH